MRPSTNNHTHAHTQPAIYTHNYYVFVSEREDMTDPEEGQCDHVVLRGKSWGKGSEARPGKPAKELKFYSENNRNVVPHFQKGAGGGEWYDPSFLFKKSTLTCAGQGGTDVTPRSWFWGGLYRSAWYPPGEGGWRAVTARRERRAGFETQESSLRWFLCITRLTGFFQLWVYTLISWRYLGRRAPPGHGRWHHLPRLSTPSCHLLPQHSLNTRHRHQSSLHSTDVR